jgi:hypothetical protein
MAFAPLTLFQEYVDWLEEGGGNACGSGSTIYTQTSPKTQHPGMSTTVLLTTNPAGKGLAAVLLDCLEQGSRGRGCRRPIHLPALAASSLP